MSDNLQVLRLQSLASRCGRTVMESSSLSATTSSKRLAWATELSHHVSPHLTVNSVSLNIVNPARVCMRKEALLSSVSTCGLLAANDACFRTSGSLEATSSQLSSVSMSIVTVDVAWRDRTWRRWQPAACRCLGGNFIDSLPELQQDLRKVQGLQHSCQAQRCRLRGCWRQ